MNPFDKLRDQLAAEKTARLRAEAAVAEMREIIHEIARCGGHLVITDEFWRKANRADSLSCGDGWLSPEDKAKVREYVEESTEHYYPNCYSGKPNPNCRKCRILALLDGKEAK